MFGCEKQEEENQSRVRRQKGTVCCSMCKLRVALLWRQHLRSETWKSREATWISVGEGKALQVKKRKCKGPGAGQAQYKNYFQSKC